MFCEFACVIIPLYCCFSEFHSSVLVIQERDEAGCITPLPARVSKTHTTQVQRVGVPVIVQFSHPRPPPLRSRGKGTKLLIQLLYDLCQITVYRGVFCPLYFSPFHTCKLFRLVLNSPRQGCVLFSIFKEKFALCNICPLTMWGQKKWGWGCLFSPGCSIISLSLTLSVPSYPKLHIATARSNFSIIASFQLKWWL